MSAVPSMGPVIPKDASTSVFEALLSHIPESGPYKIADVVDATMHDLEFQARYILELWLWEQGRRTLHEFLRTKQLDERHRASVAARNADFLDAVDAAGNGDTSKLSPFMVAYEVNSNHERKRVAEMVAADHKYVASQYRLTAKRAGMLDAFHSAVAKRLEGIGIDATTATIFSEEEYVRLQRSIVGKTS